MRRGLAAGLAGAALLAGGVAVTTAVASGHDVVLDAPPRPGHAVASVTRFASGPVVLVSGRDDHGEQASAHVDVHAAPGSGPATGEVRDGTLARVVAVEGTWLQLRTLEGPSVQGWVDDFHLRREVHLVGPPPGCRVTLDGHGLPAGEQAVVLDVRARQVRVQLLGGSTAGWVSRAAVHELAPREGCGSSVPSAAPAGGHHH